MNGAKLILACLVCVGLTVPACLAVTCDSFTSPEECNGIMTDAGECAWNEEESVCELSGTALPDGMVGITAVPAAGDGGDEGTPLPTNDTFCTQPAKQGVCRAYIPAFYFDAATNSCEPFVYGGCDGNMNNFVTGEQCKEAAEEFCTDQEVTISSSAMALRSALLLLGTVLMATVAQLM